MRKRDVRERRAKSTRAHSSTEVDDDHSAIQVFVRVLGPTTSITFEGQLESRLLSLPLASLLLFALSNLLDNERR